MSTIATMGPNAPVQQTCSDGYYHRCPFDIGYTGQRCSGSPTVVWFGGKFICYFKVDNNSGDIYYITSLKGLEWTCEAMPTHLSCSDEPVAVVFNNEVHLFFRDGGGNGLFHVSSSTGKFDGENTVQYPGLDIDFKPSAAIQEDGSSKSLVVLARGHHSNDIVFAKQTVDTKTNCKGTWSTGLTGFHCNGTPSIIYFKGQFLCYFQDPATDANGVFFITSDDGTKWMNKYGDNGTTKFDASSSPAPVVVNGMVYVFYRDRDGNGIMNMMSNDGITFTTPLFAYTGLNCNPAPGVACSDNGSTVVVAQDNLGTNVNYAVAAAL